VAGGGTRQRRSGHVSSKDSGSVQVMLNSRTEGSEVVNRTAEQDGETKHGGGCACVSECSAGRDGSPLCVR